MFGVIFSNSLHGNLYDYLMYYLNKSHDALIKSYIKITQ